MSHIHDVYDTDPHFSVDSRTRAITDQSTTPTTLMQYDHNSVQITFDIPRYIDDHDMSTCNKVEVHYVNIGTSSQRKAGLYEIEDLKINPNDKSMVTCTWLISQNATSLVGTLSFLLRFKCTRNEADQPDYVWNTAVYSAISVGTGMNNSKDIATQYADVLQEWYYQLMGAGDSSMAQIEKKKDEIIASITGKEVVNTVVDAATKATLSKLGISQIINEVLVKLPKAEEASF